MRGLFVPRFCLDKCKCLAKQERKKSQCGTILYYILPMVWDLQVRQPQQHQRYGQHLLMTPNVWSAWTTTLTPSCTSAVTCVSAIPVAEISSPVATQSVLCAVLPSKTSFAPIRPTLSKKKKVGERGGLIIMQESCVYLRTKGKILFFVLEPSYDSEGHRFGEIVVYGSFLLS